MEEAAEVRAVVPFGTRRPARARWMASRSQSAVLTEVAAGESEGVQSVVLSANERAAEAERPVVLFETRSPLRARWNANRARWEHVEAVQSMEAAQPVEPRELTVTEIQRNQEPPGSDRGWQQLYLDWGDALGERRGRFLNR